MRGWLHPDAVFPAVLVLCLIGSLRQIAVLERAGSEIAGAMAHLGRFTAPLGRFARRDFDAEDPELHKRRSAEEAQARDFLVALFASAETSRADLIEGRRRVPAAVLRRPSGRTDELIVQPWTLAGLSVGLPVVHRDVYVGRVSELLPEERALRVSLITGRDTFVGARVLPPAALVERGLASEQDAVELVVGGVQIEGRGPLDQRRALLAAHYPSRGRSAFRDGELRGAVTVHELLPELDRYSALAEGYGLGLISRGEGEEDWRVEPQVDYLSGLFHVVVLAPAEAGDPQPPPPTPPLAEDRWVPAVGTSPGDPAPWGHSIQLNRGAASGVTLGAAVVRGVRLVGRIAARSRTSSEVQLLADRGLELPAACELHLEGQDGTEPRVLGRITSLGRSPDGGRVRFHWRDVLPIELEGFEPGDHVLATVYTGSGEAGLPAGLLVGRAWLPVGGSGGRGHVFEFEDLDEWFAGEADVWVRRVPGGVR